VRSGIVAAAIAALAFLFIRSVQDTRAEPYTIPAEYLEGWSLALERSSDPAAPRLTLQPPQALMPDLFRQVFTRAMESMSTPNPAGIPLVLQRELQDVPPNRVGGDALLAAARHAGLDRAVLKPRCMAFRHTSTIGSSRQLYFLLFDMPEFPGFREQVRKLLAEAGSRGFDPNSLSPVLVVAASDPRFSSWFPLRADPTADCVAPVAIR
jgi:hypothetical protein